MSFADDTIGNLETGDTSFEGFLLGDRYKIIRKIGEGGMGAVFLAEDTALDNRPVAIKSLPLIVAGNERSLKQLKKEAKLALKLSHSHIVTLRSFESSDHGPYLVMDYIDGQTLETMLTAKERLSEEEVIRLFRPIAEALDYAHSQGVVHRDIKPSNIMIREDGVPFIMDFGIAREMKESFTRLTGKDTSGTLPYMSPEQVNGELPSQAQDIYSLAATMYECLTGEPLFCRGNIIHQIMNKEVDGSKLPDGLRDIVLQGLSKQPEDRPKTCVELLTTVSPEELKTKRETREIETTTAQLFELANLPHEDPLWPELLNVSHTWLQNGQTVKARICVDRALELASENGEIQNILNEADIYDLPVSEASMEKALEALETITEKLLSQLDKAEYYVSYELLKISSAWLQNGRKDKARICVDRALELASENGEIQNILKDADIYDLPVSEASMKKALEDLETITEKLLSQDDDECVDLEMLSISRAWLQNGRTDKARICADRALQWASENCNIEAVLSDSDIYDLPFSRTAMENALEVLEGEAAYFAAQWVQCATLWWRVFRDEKKAAWCLNEAERNCDKEPDDVQKIEETWFAIFGSDWIERRIICTVPAVKRFIMKVHRNCEITITPKGLSFIDRDDAKNNITLSAGDLRGARIAGGPLFSRYTDFKVILANGTQHVFCIETEEDTEAVQKALRKTFILR
jgi:serine/threonine protein kinase